MWGYSENFNKRNSIKLQFCSRQFETADSIALKFYHHIIGGKIHLYAEFYEDVLLQEELWNFIVQNTE